MQQVADEVQTFQLQALEIRELDASFDPKTPPQTGEEFLMHMLYERKRCPAVVTKRPAKISNDIVTAANGLQGVVSPPLPPHKCLLPTPEWQRAQAQSFQQTRAHVAALRRELHAQRYDQTIEPPLTTEADKWLQFCRAQAPLLSTLLRLSQKDLEQLLELHSKWLLPAPADDDEPNTSAAAAAAAAALPCDLHGRDSWLARWIYATLVCLHFPLEPHVHSTLRCIARSCVQLRDQLRPAELQQAAPHNLIISLIASEFAQTDFAVYL